MKTLRFILGDQLSRDISALDGADPASDVILMAEAADETRYVPHHVQKIAFILAAMRHHAAALRTAGFAVDYVTLDAPGNTGSFTGELQRAVARHWPDRIVATEPGEWRVFKMMRGWAGLTGLPVEIRADDRFLCSRGEVADANVFLDAIKPWRGASQAFTASGYSTPPGRRSR